MKVNKAGIFLISFFILFGVAFLGYYYKVSSEQPKRSPLPILGNVPDHKVAPFSFVNQDGKTITNEDIKGKIVVVDYFFATCMGICPKMNQNLAKVYERFKGNKDVIILSHTVDPVKDTVAALKAYSIKFGADAGQWMFLTGDKQQLYDMARYSYLISAQDDTAGISIDKDFIHDNHYVLIDNYGRLRGMYDGLDDAKVDSMIGHIVILLDEKTVKYSPVN